MTTGGPVTGGTLRQDNRRSPGTLAARSDLPPRVRSVLENLADHDYELVRGYNTPGRSAFVEVTWRP